MSDLVIVSEYKLWGRVFVYIICATWLSACLYSFMFENYFLGLHGVIKLILISSIPLVAAYMVHKFELRVYEDRITQRRLTLKTIYYRDIGEVHLSATWDPYRIRVYERGSSMPGVAIPRGVANWQHLGAALLSRLPEGVRLTGSEKLRADLEDRHVAS